MIPSTKPFLALTAADLMSPATVVIPRDMTLQGAAHLLAQADVNGAPVIDPDGRCVGVISAHDFIMWAERGKRPPQTEAGGWPCYCSAWSIPDDDAGGELVRDFMTADPATIAPSAVIGTLAEAMLDAHIHRLIVVDAARRPVGVVSSTDVLAAVAHAARVAEMTGEPSPAARERCDDPLHPCAT